MIYYINENKNEYKSIDSAFIESINSINNLYIDYLQESSYLIESNIKEKIKSVIAKLWEKIKNFFSTIISKIRQIIAKGKAKALLEKIKNAKNKKRSSTEESAILEDAESAEYIYTNRDFDYILDLTKVASNAVSILGTNNNGEAYSRNPGKDDVNNAKQVIEDIETFISHSANKRTKVDEYDSLDKLEGLAKDTVDKLGSIFEKLNAVQKDCKKVLQNANKVDDWTSIDIDNTDDDEVKSILNERLKAYTDAMNEVTSIIYTIVKQLSEMYIHNINTLSRLVSKHIQRDLGVI